VPADAADAIARRCQAGLFNLPSLAADAESAGNLAIPAIAALRQLVAQEDAAAAGFVHWGATSQDALDTGLILQIRTGTGWLDAKAGSLIEHLTSLAEKHAATPMLGRTWLQAAVPITFGLAVAGWLCAVERSRARLARAVREASVIQFGGAAGSLASLGPRGNIVAEALAKELQLDVPEIPWHAQRDRIVDVGAALGSLVGTLGKTARDISLLMQTEVAEVSEPAAPGRGTSSSMPHKRNPVASAAVLAAATRAPGLVTTLLAGMSQEHQRGLGGWQAEWSTLPELFLVAADALSHVTDAIGGLVVNPARMRENIDATHGLVMAEAVAMALTPALGRQRAQERVEAASRVAEEQRIHLRDALARDNEVSRHLTSQKLDDIFSLDEHTRTAAELVKRVLAASTRV
jgi:3-carboxy-cis,cis-muconate cycloisomerase